MSEQPQEASESPEIEVCKVEGCQRLMSEEGMYYRRYSVCKEHLRSQRLLVDGRIQRFCQQCGRFQDIGEFDEEKRSCRTQLEHHSRRRRLKLAEQRLQRQQQQQQQQMLKQYHQQPQEQHKPSGSAPFRPSVCSGGTVAANLGPDDASPATVMAEWGSSFSGLQRERSRGARPWTKTNDTAQNGSGNESQFCLDLEQAPAEPLHRESAPQLGPLVLDDLGALAGIGLVSLARRNDSSSTAQLGAAILVDKGTRLLGGNASARPQERPMRLGGTLPQEQPELHHQLTIASMTGCQSSAEEPLERTGAVALSPPLQPPPHPPQKDAPTRAMSLTRPEAGLRFLFSGTTPPLRPQPQLQPQQQQQQQQHGPQQEPSLSAVQSPFRSTGLLVQPPPAKVPDLSDLNTTCPQSIARDLQLERELSSLLGELADEQTRCSEAYVTGSLVATSTMVVGAGAAGGGGVWAMGSGGSDRTGTGSGPSSGSELQSVPQGQPLRLPMRLQPPPPPPLPMPLTAASAAGGNDSGQKDSDGGRAGDGNDSQAFQRALWTPRDTVDFSAGEANMLQTNGDGGAGQIRSGEVSGSASAPLPYLAAAIDVATAGISCMDWLPSGGGRDSMHGNIDGAQQLGLHGSGVRLLSAPQLLQPPGPAVLGALDSSSSAPLHSSSGGGGHGQGNNSAAEAHLRLVRSSPFQRARAYVTADVPVPPPYLLEPVNHDQQQRQFSGPNVQLGSDSHFHGQQLQPPGQPPIPQRSNVPPSAVSPAYHPAGSCDGGSCRGISSSCAVHHTGGLSLNYSAADLPECSQLQPQQPLSLPVQNPEQLLQRRSLQQQQQVMKEHHAAPFETSGMARATGLLLSQPLQQSMAPQYLGMQSQLQMQDNCQYYQSPEQLPPSQPSGQQSNRLPKQLIDISGANLLSPSGAAGASLPHGIADNQLVSQLVPYNSNQLLQRLSFKLHGCSPSDLMPDSRAKLQSWLTSMSLQMLQYTTRSGCTLIIADVLVPAAAAAAAAGSGDPNRWLLARIVEGPAAGQGPGFADAAAAVLPLPPLPQSLPANNENIDLSGMGLRDPPHSASCLSAAGSPYQKGSKRPSTATDKSSREGGAYVDVDTARRSDGHGRPLALKFGVERPPTSDDTDRTSDASTGSSTGTENEGSGIGGDSRHDNSDTPHDVSSGDGVARDYIGCDAIAGKAPDLMEGCRSPSELVQQQLAAPQGPAAAAAAATTDDDDDAAAAAVTSPPTAAAVTSPPTAAAEVAAAVSAPPTVSAFRPMGQIGGPTLELLRILLGPLVAQPDAGEMGAVTDQTLLIQLEDQVVCMTWPRRLTADQRVAAAGVYGDGNAARGEHVTSGAGDPLLAAGGEPPGQDCLETLAAAGVWVTPPPPTLLSLRPAAVTAGHASSLRVMIRLPPQSPLGNAVSGAHGGGDSTGCGQGPPVMLHLRYNGACVLSCELQPGDLRPVTGRYGAPTEVTDTQRQLFQERQVPGASDAPSAFSPSSQKPSASAGDIDLPDQPAGSSSQRWPMAASTMGLNVVENHQLPSAAAEAEAPAIQMTPVSSLAAVSGGAGADVAVCTGGHADAGMVVEYTLHVPSLATPGLAFVETSCGDVLGPWMPLPVVPSEAAAAEISSLTYERSLLHLFLCDLGRLLMLSAAGACLEEAGYTDDWDAYEAYCELRNSIPDAEVVAGRLLRKCIDWRLPECTALSTSLFLGVVGGGPL